MSQSEYTLYVDYAGGKFEAWYYKNGRRARVDEFMPDYGDVRRYFDNSPFTKLSLTGEAELFSKK